MYTHEKIMIACYEIGLAEVQPLTAIEVVAEMNHAAWEMMEMGEDGLKKRIAALAARNCK